MLCVAHPSRLARKRRAREARAADRNADGPEDNPRRTACIAGMWTWPRFCHTCLFGSSGFLTLGSYGVVVTTQLPLKTA